MMNEVLRVLILRPPSHHAEVTAAMCAASGFIHTVVLWSGKILCQKNVLFNLFKAYEKFYSENLALERLQFLLFVKYCEKKKAITLTLKKFV